MSEALNRDQPDAIILGCVKTKAPGTHPARDLYTSALWRRRRQHAEASGVPWFIFSAKYGLVVPARRIDSYDLRLADLPAAGRAAKGEAAAANLERLLDGLRAKRIEIHAGAKYVSAIQGPIEARGGKVLTPLEGQSIGHQLRWYIERAADS